jgi:hypothetical protein
MYCHRSFAAKVRVSLVFSQPATLPEAGNASTFAFLHPALAARTASANAVIATFHLSNLNISNGSPFPALKTCG